jgi:hypothetical protein
MTPTLAQANAILACPYVQWGEQARQLIPVIEGLVGELLDAQMDTRRLDWIEKHRALIYYFRGRPLFSVTESGAPKWTLREAIDDAAATALAQPPTPATSGTHQPDSVTGDAHSQAFPLSPVPMLDDCMENIRRNVAEMDRIAAMEKDPLELEPQTP